MNRLNTCFHTHFATESLTPGTRLIALGFLLVQAPFAILSILLFFLLPVTFPSLIFYYCYWRMYRQTISLAAAKAVWLSTAAYYSLIGVGLYLLSGAGGSGFYALLPFVLIPAVALIAWTDLRDKEATVETILNA